MSQEMPWNKGRANPGDGSTRAVWAEALELQATGARTHIQALKWRASELRAEADQHSLPLPREPGSLRCAEFLSFSCTFLAGVR